MNKSFAPLLLALSLISSLVQAKEFSQHGFTFSYSDELDVTVTGDAIKTIIVKNDKGIQFLMQNYKALIQPDRLNKMMVQSLLEKFGENAQQLQTRKAVRPILGANRTGDYLLIVNEGAPMECLVFTFTKGGNTYCVMTQQALKDTPAAEKYFKEIQDSLKSEE